jgi:deoxyribodipyrimidine photo-lyase
MHLFWHRRDLRIADNRGLAATARTDTVVPVYVVDDRVLSAVGPRKRAFLAAAVRDLRRTYRSRGGDLVIREGDPAEVLPALAVEYDADGVAWNDHYSADRRSRQRRVDAACARSALETKSYTDLVLVDPSSLDVGFSTHAAFAGAWHEVPKSEPEPEPAADALAGVDGDAGPSTTAGNPPRDAADGVDVPGSSAADEFLGSAADIDLPDAGYEAARSRLDEFLAGGIRTYRDTRDDLTRAVADPGRAVSRLSPHLAAGTIGIREVWADVTAILDATSGEERSNVQKYRSELTWRERYYHLLYHRPDLRTANYRSFSSPVAWRDDDEGFAAWAAGETGYPLVDAGMRQLEREGYVHNRPRQVVASFLTKHLLVDWRRGERHFADRLVDFDPANNAGNWQWVASTGTDSVDVRIFDPVSQARKYDPDAAFVAEYVPELRGVPAEDIVEWPTLGRRQREDLAPLYPHPIVDRDDAYERARRVFETALGKR